MSLPRRMPAYGSVMLRVVEEKRSQNATLLKEAPKKEKQKCFAHARVRARLRTAMYEYIPRINAQKAQRKRCHAARIRCRTTDVEKCHVKRRHMQKHICYQHAARAYSTRTYVASRIKCKRALRIWSWMTQKRLPRVARQQHKMAE